MTTIIERIDAALDTTGAIVAAITPDQLATPSLCPGWDLRAELNHLVGGMSIFAAQLSGTEAGAEHEADWLGNDPRRAYTDAAAVDREAWHRPDALAATVRLSFGAVPAPMAALIHLTEVLVHGADLAVATGQEHRVDQNECEQLLATMRGMDFTTFRRPGMFGAEQPAPDDAPAHLRLLAFLGRERLPAFLGPERLPAFLGPERLPAFLGRERLSHPIAAVSVEAGPRNFAQ